MCRQADAGELNEEGWMERRTIPIHVRRRARPAAERPRGLPHVYSGGSRSGRRGAADADRSSQFPGGRFRWLISTCLAAGVGTVAIVVVIYGSTDHSELMPALEQMYEGKRNGILAPRRTDGLRWALPKADKLQTTGGAQTVRAVVLDRQNVRKANRDYIYAKPYVRIVSRLGPVAPGYVDVIPPFNPFKLHAAERRADTKQDGATPNDVKIRVVDLLGGILPGDDGQEFDVQEVTAIVARAAEQLAAAREASNTVTDAVGAVPGRDDAPGRRLAEEPAPVNTTTLTKPKAATGGPPTDADRTPPRIVKVTRAETLQRILQQAGADVWTAKAMADAAKPHVPEATLAAGHEVQIVMVPSLTVPGRTEPAHVAVFGDGRTHRVSIVRNGAAEITASATPVDAPTAGETVEGREAQLASLYASFYATALAQSVPPDTIGQMLRIHAHETDFRRRVQPSDSMEMFFDARDDSGPDTPPGDLLYTAITSGGTSGRFWRFRTPDGIVDFYNENGSNARRFLMRKPVRSDDVRLTSGFGLRVHPLFNDRRMHNGIDWAGPIGTPVVAAGNGVVEEVAFKGGNGRFVRIGHGNGYQTSYSHLQGFARGLEPGMKVRQGQVIGTLGNSGYSTGPHLHFEVLVNGRNVDPLSVPVPRERQLSGKQLTDFFREKARIDELMRRPPVAVYRK
jgi:murein DD-endopeptidase MepM/ murein hydrolase activator NlpD